MSGILYKHVTVEKETTLLYRFRHTLGTGVNLAEMGTSGIATSAIATNVTSCPQLRAYIYCSVTKMYHYMQRQY